jgi:hypothetical protein
MSDDLEGARNRNEWPYVGGLMFVNGATVWGYDRGDARVVPWERYFGNVEAGYWDER